MRIFPHMLMWFYYDSTYYVTTSSCVSVHAYKPCKHERNIERRHSGTAPVIQGGGRPSSPSGPSAPAYLGIEPILWVEGDISLYMLGFKIPVVAQNAER